MSRTTRYRSRSHLDWGRDDDTSARAGRSAAAESAAAATGGRSGGASGGRIGCRREGGSLVARATTRAGGEETNRNEATVGDASKRHPLLLASTQPPMADRRTDHRRDRSWKHLLSRETKNPDEYHFEDVWAEG